MARYFLAVTFVLCAVLLGTAVAQEKQEKKDEAAANPAKITRTGQVVSIDAMKNEIVIKDNAGVETHLLVATSTKINRAGKTITLADVKAGDTIACECEDSADGCKAKSITVTPAPSQ